MILLPRLRLLGAAAFAALVSMVWAGPVRVGLEPYEPYSYIDSQGQLVGFSVDVLKAIARTENLELEFVYKPWAELLRDFEAGKIDVLGNVSFSNERLQAMDLSVVYSTLPASVYVNRSLPEIRSLEDLRGLRIAVTKGALTHSWLLQQKLTDRIVARPTVRESLRSAGLGEADAVISSQHIADAIIRLDHLDHLRRVDLPLPGLAAYRFHFAVHRGDRLLLYQINAGLAELRASGQYEPLYERWLKPLAPRPVRLRDLLPYLVPVAAVLVVVLGVLFWVLRLLAQLRRQSEALRSSEERYRRFFEENLAGAFISRPDGVIVRCNQSFARIFGFPHETAAQGTSLLQLGGTATDLPVLLANLGADGRGQTLELELRRPDGQPVQVIANLVGVRARDGSLQEIKGYLIDVSETRRLAQQLQQAQKMEAIGNLAGGIAHDFNNILTSVMGNTELARMELPKDSQARELLGHVLTSAGRARDLVRQILSFSRRQPLRREPVDLTECVREALRLLRPLLPANVELHPHLTGPLPPALADATQVQQVLMNLATNSAHALGERGGVIELWAEPVQVDEAMTEQRPQLKPGAYIRLRVNDAGCGMDAETVARAFEPYFTTKGLGKGTGLGLAVVHGIMQQHEGAVQIYSAPGQGTSIHLYFPVSAAEAASAATTVPATPAGAGQRVVVVDDEVAVVHVAERLLRQAGYRVTVHTSPLEALKSIRAAPASVDLLITDLSMPQMQGTALARELRILRPNLPIILWTGFGGELDSQLVLSLGLYGPVQKPFSAHDLLAAVGEALQGHSTK